MKNLVSLFCRTALAMAVVAASCCFTSTAEANGGLFRRHRQNVVVQRVKVVQPVVKQQVVVQQVRQHYAVQAVAVQPVVQQYVQPVCAVQAVQAQSYYVAPVLGNSACYFSR